MLTKIADYALVKYKTAGFCMGVKRAIEIALDAAKNKPSPIFTLGPLIHNDQAVKMLSKKSLICPVCNIARRFPGSKFARMIQRREKNCPACKAYQEVFCNKKPMFSKVIHQAGNDSLPSGNSFTFNAFCIMLSPLCSQVVLMSNCL